MSVWPAVAIIIGMTRGAEARLFVALDLPAELRGRLLGWARTAARRACRAGSATASGTPASAIRDAGLAQPASGGTTAADPPAATACARLACTSRSASSATGPWGRSRRSARPSPPSAQRRRRSASSRSGRRCGCHRATRARSPWSCTTLPTRALEALHGALAARLQPGISRRFRPQARAEGRRRRFRPHVTVARMRPAEAPRERGAAAHAALAFTPRSVTLHRSWLTPTEAVYEALDHARASRL